MPLMKVQDALNEMLTGNQADSTRLNQVKLTSAKASENLDLLAADKPRFGAEIVDDTATHTVDAHTIHFLQLSLIDTLTATDWTGSLNGKLIPAGTVIYGNFTSLKLKTDVGIDVGLAVMYKKEPAT